MKFFLSHPIKSIKYRYNNRVYGKYVFRSPELKDIIDRDRKKAINILWWKHYHKEFPWKNPQTLNEKITWLSGASDTSLWTKYTDKFEVRKHVEELGLGHILTKCYGVWDRVEDIDFDSLPNNFVLKCTHDCGSTIIIRDKQKELDIPKITKFLNEHLAKIYGYDYVEPHYTKIKPRVMAEEVIPNLSNGIESHSAIDYKIWCVNNKAVAVMVLYDRYLGSEGVASAVLDLYDVKTWQPIRHNLSEPYRKAKFKDIPKPNNYEEMIRIAELLSSGFPIVRVDLYNVKGKIYFGELKFTSQGGRMNYYTDEFQYKIGRMINIQSSMAHAANR